MSVDADLSFDSGAITAQGDRIVRAYLTAGTKAVSGTVKRLERTLEAATQRAVPGRLYLAWQSRAYPEKGPARNPAGTITLKGGARTRGAVQFWTQPGAIRGKSGQYLAVPLPSAGSRGRGRDLTPGEWERRTGKRLTFIYRQGKPSLLVAVGGTTGARGQFRALTGGKRGRIAQGRGGANPQADAIIPIFILLPMVRFRNAFAIEPIVNASEGELVRAFLSAVSEVK